MARPKFFGQVIKRTEGPRYQLPYLEVATRGAMQVLSSKECYDRAAEAHAMAEAAASPDERSDLLQVEWRWLHLARYWVAEAHQPEPKRVMCDT